MNYFRQHWRGELSLSQSFWINFASPIALLVLGSSLTSKLLLTGGAHTATVLTVLFVVLLLLVYVWQFVGVLRASERYALERGDRAWSTAAQGGAVLSIVFVVVIVFGAYQNLLAFKQSLEAPAATAAEKAYSLTLDEQSQRLFLKGPLQSGITRAFKKVLALNPGLELVVLESDGGRIYEGRGLSMAIRESGLATHVEIECMSACTTAFIGGDRRTISATAKLGFHQYKTYSIQQNINVQHEQRRDTELFLRQGVDEAFLHKVFSTPFEEIWFPSADALLQAGVVHEAGAVLNLTR